MKSQSHQIPAAKLRCLTHLTAQVAKAICWSFTFAMLFRYAMLQSHIDNVDYSYLQRSLLTGENDDDVKDVLKKLRILD